MLKAIHIQHFKGLKDVLIPDCGGINIFVGKNNAGKSSILHAIDMVGLAIANREWERFPLKLAIQDLFSEAGPFSVDLKFSDGSQLTVSTNPSRPDRPELSASPTDEQRFTTMLVLPEGETGLLRRRHQNPQQIVNQVEQRQFGEVSGLDILFALRFYAERGERGYTLNDYQQIIDEVRHFFPELDRLEADRTDQDIATVTYEEYGRRLDILYAGAGLKHVLDILIKIALSKANVILLDEPEAGMHPALQRRFLGLLKRMVKERNLTFFVSTHSPVLLAEEETVHVYRIVNTDGNRELLAVDSGAMHTLWGDLGIRPSDLLQNDIVVLVEGATDVIFLQHVIETFYADEFHDLAVAVIQFGGSGADGVISGTISISNIASAQGHVLWIRDKDSAVEEPPASNIEAFAEAIRSAGHECHIWSRREIEFYFPESVLVAAQQGNSQREEEVRSVLAGN